MKLNAKTLIIAGIVVVAMGLEAAIIYMVLPPQAVEAKPTEEGDVEKKPAPEETPVVDDMSEVLIDSFNCTNNGIAPGSVVHLSFKVICIVPARQQLAFEENANRTHKTRVRQSIERIARSATLEDLNDPSLSTIKRLIREETNKTLGRSFVSEVVVTDFRMMEQ